MIDSCYMCVLRHFSMRDPARPPLHGIKLLAFAYLILSTATPAKATPPPILYTGTEVQLSAPSGFNFPAGLALDLSGDLYIADGLNNRIVKVAPDGTSSGFPISGVGALHLPLGLAVDSAGDLYIADSNNQRIVKSDPSGNGSVLSTGNIGLNYPDGVAVDTLGHVFISDFINDQIVEITSPGDATVLSITGLSNPTSLSAPSGLATDTYNNLYIVDNGNHRLVKVTPVSPSTSLVGSGAGSVVSFTPAFTDAQSVTVGNNGIIYVTDNVPNTSRRIAVYDPQGHNYDLFDDQINSELGTFVWGIATDSKGAFYVSDESGNAVKLFHQGSVDFGHVQAGNSSATQTLNFTIDAATTVTSVASYVAGTLNGTATNTTCLTTSGGACTVNLKFSPVTAGLQRAALVLSYDNTNSGPGNFTVPLFGIGDGPVPAVSPGVVSPVSTGSASLNQPFQTATDGSGNTYLTDTANNRVLKVPAGGGNATTVATGGISLNGPTGLAIDGAGNLFIADAGIGQIVEMTAAGTAQVITINGLSTPLSNPQSLFIDGSGNMFVDDAGNNRIVQLTVDPFSTDNTLAVCDAFVLATGGLSLGTGTSLNSPYNFSTSAVVDTGESLYISDDVNNRVIKVDRFGAASLVDFSSVSPALLKPNSVALDPMGNLYVMDQGAGAGAPRIIQQFTTGTNSVVSFSGTTLGVTPNQLAVDNSGNVLIADYSGTQASSRLVAINVAQSMLNFPDTPQNSTSAPMTATVTNLGDQPFSFGTDPTYPPNFSMNTGDMNLCATGITLTVGMTCDVSILFTPQAAGFQRANIFIPGSALMVVASGTTPGPTTTTVTLLPPSSVYGEPVTFTATVSATGGTLTGTVTFTDLNTGTAFAANVLLNSQGAAQATTSVLAVGLHTIQAVYTPTGNFAPSSGSRTITIGKASTITGITATGNTLTVTVAAVAPGAGTPTGSVQFLNNGTGIGGGTLSGGTATLTVNLTPPYSLTAVSSGDTNFIGSTSSALLSTATTVTASPTSPISGQSVTFTATISSPVGTPTGTVVFTDLDTSATWDAPLTSGVATVTSSTLAPGSHTILAVYFPSGNFVASNGSTTVTIAQSGPTNVTSGVLIGPGIFRGSNGLWLLDSNYNNKFDSGDKVPLFAGNGLTPQSTDIAVVGDWDGSGTTKIGLYRPSTGTWFLDYNGNGIFDGPGVDRQYQYGGSAGDIPVVGDWTGNGLAKVGIFRQGFQWLLNLSGDGTFSGGTNDAVFAFGGATGCTGSLPGVYKQEPAGSCDIPVVGDWNRSGTTKVGVMRAAPKTSQPFLWILDTSGAQAYIATGPTASTVFAFGGIAGDVPVVGDWTDSGKTSVGVFRDGFLWVEDTTAGLPATPAAGDTLVTFPYGGIPGDQAVVGHW